MSTRRTLSTRGMGVGHARRPLLDVDVTRSEVDDPKRREFCNNGKKYRRMTQPMFQDFMFQAYRPNRNNPNKKMKLDQVESVINPFSLSRIAYINCSTKEREKYDTMPVPKMDVKTCCYSLKNRVSDVMNHALENKHLECFIHGHKMGFELPYWGCYSALAHECVDILKYTHENGCDFVVDLAFKEAAINGHLPCFKYIHQVGGLLTVDVMKAVVIHGNLSCLKYLLQNNCEWTIDMCALSANSGDLDFVKFCQDNGCPWVVVDPSHWYIWTANIVFLKDDKKKESVDLVKAMKMCAKYIQATAEMEDRCKLSNYPDLKMFSITL